MISVMAKEDIELMRAEGLNPTVEDIIRLNVYGLKIEEKRKSRQDCSFHRVAILKDGLYLRQPTIAHELWLNKIGRYIEEYDYETDIAITIFALSKKHDELPDADDIESVKKCMNEFQIVMSEFSKEQLDNALDYVVNGCKLSSHEHLPASHDDNEVEEDENWDECIAVGLLKNGVEMKLGLTLKEMKEMTHRELCDLIENVSIQNASSNYDVAKYECINYYKVLDDIKARLTNEKMIGDNNGTNN